MEARPVHSRFDRRERAFSPFFQSLSRSFSCSSSPLSSLQTADILSFASGGWLKSTIHRVIRPPEDQANVHRLGVSLALPDQAAIWLTPRFRRSSSTFLALHGTIQRMRSLHRQFSNDSESISRMKNRRKQSRDSSLRERG